MANPGLISPSHPDHDAWDAWWSWAEGAVAAPGDKGWRSSPCADKAHCGSIAGRCADCGRRLAK